ncbi:MAG: cation:proton antiporter [Phycisphaerales bacterium]
MIPASVAGAGARCSSGSGRAAILGYLLAGLLLGLHALDRVHGVEFVHAVAELGVSLLLFVIGLEFSLRRLLKIGAVGLGGGTLQVILTCALGSWAARLLGVAGPEAIAIGVIVSLSSTACVLRVLTDRAEMDSVTGRTCLGILLLQDMAVVPLVLLVTMLGGEPTVGAIVKGMGWSVVLIAGLGGGLYLIIAYVLPRVMRDPTLARNRELSIMLAVVLALGSAWAAHEFKLSPAIGAFIAGMLLAESPFAVQVRADVGALRALFVTLFFTSVGMLGDPAWIASNWVLIAVTVGVILVGKILVTTVVVRLFGTRLRHAAGAAVSLAQVGEFSFVLAQVAYDNGEGVLSDGNFKLFVSATLVTLFLTPYLVAGGPKFGRGLQSLARRVGISRPDTVEPPAAGQSCAGHLIVIGFGPAAQRMAQKMFKRHGDVMVIDLNPRNLALARGMGLSAQVGDATSPELMHHLHIHEARAVVVTIPDHRAAVTIVRHIRHGSPDLPIIARSRYHTFAEDLRRAGATVAVDEEDWMGRRLGLEVNRLMRESVQERHASDDSAEQSEAVPKDRSAG